MYDKNSYLAIFAAKKLYIDFFPYLLMKNVAIGRFSGNNFLKRDYSDFSR